MNHPDVIEVKRSRALVALLDECVTLVRKVCYKYNPKESVAVCRERTRLWVYTGIFLNEYYKASRQSHRTIYREVKRLVPAHSFPNQYRAMSVAAYFSNDLKAFDEWFDVESAFHTITAVYNTLYATSAVGDKKRNKYEYKSPLEKAMREIDTMTLHASRHSDGHEKYVGDMFVLRRYIDARLPAICDFTDDTFFQYAPCCACGKNPGEDGWPELFEAEHGSIAMPVAVCTECAEGGQEVSWARVAHMYFLYSLTAQDELVKRSSSDAVQIGRNIFGVHL